MLVNICTEATSGHLGCMKQLNGYQTTP